ncbi:hypothetical protein AMECASPLE_025544 [Ameca splendens]|uniref:Uncharacterized protein n=1 Tax=Ameca splendens TaxID=208324 RepID=A0ABV0YS19_9TELE
MVLNTDDSSVTPRELASIPVSATTNQKHRWSCCSISSPPVRPVHLALSSSIASPGTSRCLARRQSSNQIHFICNQLEPPALMEEIRAPIKEL